MSVLIVLTGITGAINYGSEFIKSETRPTTTLPYTSVPDNSNAISMITENRTCYSSFGRV